MPSCALCGKEDGNWNGKRASAIFKTCPNAAGVALGAYGIELPEDSYICKPHATFLVTSSELADLVAKAHPTVVVPAIPRAARTRAEQAQPNLHLTRGKKTWLVPAAWESVGLALTDADPAKALLKAYREDLTPDYDREGGVRKDAHGRPINIAGAVRPAVNRCVFEAITHEAGLMCQEKPKVLASGFHGQPAKMFKEVGVRVMIDNMVQVGGNNLVFNYKVCVNTFHRTDVCIS